MKFVLVLVCGLLLAPVGNAADSTNTYYIERYPGDGFKQRNRDVPKKRTWANPLQTVAPESVEAYTNAPGATSTNARRPKAVRYTAPRVSSKGFVPSRKPEPKAKIVVVPAKNAKSFPSPSVTDKPGVGDIKINKTVTTTSTNSAPAKTESSDE